MVKTLNNTERIALRNYKYKGQDLSLLYKHVLSPWAQFCVDTFTPVTVAPNVITLTGLCLIMIALATVLIYDPTLTDAPRWVYLVVGAAMFGYQTLDNMDGKQARKTGSSSALGMLFDHGCDAINGAVGPVLMGSVLGTGWTTKLLFIQFTAMIVFYVETWEQTFTGMLNLPLINGPNEGLIAAVVCTIVSFLHGPGYWQESTNGIQVPAVLQPHLVNFGVMESQDTHLAPFYMLFCFIGGGAVVTMLKVIPEVLHLEMEKGNSIWTPLGDLLPLIVSFPSHLYWVAHSSIALNTYPHVTVFFLMATVFTDITSHLMVAYMCQSPLKPFSHYTAWASLAFPVNIVLSRLVYGADSAELLLDETFLLFSLAAVSTFLCVVSIYKFLNEFAEALDIWIFSLGKRSASD